MTLNRRKFLQTGLSGAAAALSGMTLAACTSKGNANTTCGGKGKDCQSKAELKLSFQEGTGIGESLNERFDYMEAHGVVGFEPNGGGLSGRVHEIEQALRGRNIHVSAICAGFEGFLLSTDAAVRNKCTESLKEILAAAGQLGSVGVVFVPAFNAQTPALPHTQATRDFFCQQLAEIGAFAAEHGTSVILEPLNRREAFYLRQVADAAAICRDINLPGVRCMGDFWHMTSEETCDAAAFLAAGAYLQHVHIASRRRRSMPGEDGEADNYTAGFKALKQLGYDKYVSFECGCQGDKSVVLPAALRLLRQQWEEA